MPRPNTTLIPGFALECTYWLACFLANGQRFLSQVRDHFSKVERNQGMHTDLLQSLTKKVDKMARAQEQDKWNLSSSKVQWGRELGAGSFGTVYEVQVRGPSTLKLPVCRAAKLPVCSAALACGK